MKCYNTVWQQERYWTECRINPDSIENTSGQHLNSLKSAVWYYMILEGYPNSQPGALVEKKQHIGDFAFLQLEEDKTSEGKSIR